jgi:hypothetical protein
MIPGLGLKAVLDDAELIEPCSAVLLNDGIYRRDEILSF